MQGGPRSLEVRFWLLVSEMQAGMLIGKGGDIIQRIRQESQATVKVTSHGSGAAASPSRSLQGAICEALYAARSN